MVNVFLVCILIERAVDNNDLTIHRLTYFDSQRATVCLRLRAFDRERRELRDVRLRHTLPEKSATRDNRGSDNRFKPQTEQGIVLSIFDRRPIWYPMT